MSLLSRLLLLSALVAAPLLAATAPNVKKSTTGVTLIVDTSTIPIRVTANTPEMQGLAQWAFNSHGRYDVENRNNRAIAYEFKFTSSGNQARIDIVSKASGSTTSETVTGTSPRNALLKAADVAVEKTNGMGLHGFFASKLAFISKRSGKSEVYVSDLYFGEAKQLTRDGAPALTPRWSPDGSRVIYTSYYKSGAPDIFMHDVNSGRRDTFVSLRGTNMGARFSPNGQQVAMVLTGEGTPEIYVRSAQGGPISRKTRIDAAKSSPCWSPDGSQIVFTMEPGPQLYVMSAGGGDPRRLASGYSYTAEPDWSRTDRNKIVCTVNTGGSYQIAMIEVATGKAKVVSKAAFDGVEPSWLPDGRHVVYTARDRSTSVLCILDTESGRSTPINKDSRAELQANVWGK